MDPRLLLVKCITLLYRESQLGGQTNSAELCKEVINAIKLPDNTMDVDSGREVLVGLRGTAKWMAENPANAEYDKTPLLQRIRVNVKDDTYLYQAVETGLSDLEDKDAIQKEAVTYRRDLNDYLNKGRIENLVKNAFNQLMFRKDVKDYRAFVQELTGHLEPYARSDGKDQVAGVVDSVDFDDPEGIKELLMRAKEETATEGILKTGYQAINRMLGDHGGFRRGEMVLVGALQHNFKTGFTLNLFKQLALYNTPYMRDPNKKPLLVHISAENELASNLLWLYVNLKENETGELCDVTQVDPGEASAYVKQRLEESGYKIAMRRVDPSNFTIFEYIDLISGYESQGYEVHAVVIDYLNMFNKRGCSQGPSGFEVRDLFRRVRNFGAPRGITTITPHQLSSEAKMMVRQNIDNFVQEVANKGYYDSCRVIDQEVDLEITIHIEKRNGESFLACQRGKHRKVSITPEKDLYTVLPFNTVGGIKDDLHGPDTSMRAPGGTSMAEGGENPWWE